MLIKFNKIIISILKTVNYYKINKSLLIIIINFKISRDLIIFLIITKFNIISINPLILIINKHLIIIKIMHTKIIFNQTLISIINKMLINHNNIIFKINKYNQFKSSHKIKKTHR